MIQGTTPTLTLTVPNTVDLTQAAHVYVTLSQGRTVLTLSGNSVDVDEHSVDVFITQSQSLKFSKGEVEIQLNWTDSQGKRLASEISLEPISKNLLREVVE